MIKVNRRDMDFYEGMTIKSLLDDLRYSFPNIIIWVNGEFITKDDYGKTCVKDGDNIQIIHPIAGG